MLSYLEGGEHIEFGGERYTVAAGDTFVWDSSKATQFEVYEPLHKVALAMPSRLLSHNALSALNQMPRKFDPSSGSRFLLNNLIRAVADRDFDDAEVESETILDAVNAFVWGRYQQTCITIKASVSGSVAKSCATLTSIFPTPH